MMKKSLLALASALVVLGTSPAHAQSSKELEELRNEIKQLRQELNALKQQKAGAPAADSTGWGERVEALELKQKDAVVGGDIGGSFRLPGSETSVRIYGYAEAHALHDFNGTSPGDDFTNLMEQPLRTADAGYTKNKTKITAQTSRFGFETSTPTGLGAFGTKLEMDFYAYCGAECNRNRLRLRHAYGEYAGFLVGQTWSTFMDLDNLPETVDFNGPIGSPFSRRTMIRYTYNDPKLAKFTFAFEDPEDGARYPNVVARVDKSFDTTAFNVRLLAHEKRVGTVTKSGYGVGVGGSIKLSDTDLLMGQFARVTGDYDMMYGSAGYSVDGDGNLLFDKNDGLVAGWAHTFSDKLRSNLVLGMNRSRGDETVFTNRRLTQVHAGFIYTPIKNVELGAEYIYGRRKVFGGDSGTMSRVDLMGRYSF